MKRIIRNKWFLPVVISTVLVIVCAIMFLFGWRITYAPEMENSWNAISAVATWTGTIIAMASTTASFLAVWFAIQVPKKIAEQQNKITLFEKRYEVFEIYNSCKVFSEMLRWAISQATVQLFFLNVFFNVSLDEKNIDTAYLKKESDVLVEKLRRAEFLFEPSTSSYIQEIADCFHQLITISLYQSDFTKISEKIDDFIKLMGTEQYQAVLDKMRNDLKLK